jgi:hypothetical protein
MTACINLVLKSSLFLSKVKLIMKIYSLIRVPGSYGQK